MVYHKTFADNCGTCGEEYSNVELTKIALSNWNIKICKQCAQKDIIDNYKEAAALMYNSSNNYIEAMQMLAKLKNV